MSLLVLNVDVLLLIFDQLIQRDIKSLRLVCRALECHAKLKFRRLFLSPNRVNLEVFNSVVKHQVYRLQVREIVWDDARLKDYEARGFGDDQFYDGAESMGEQMSAGRGIRACPAIDLRRKELWGEAWDARMPLEDCFLIYNDLHEEQQRIIDCEEDVAALRLGLHSLPNLKRVTLTSEAWRLHPLFPTYETPFWRSLPPGFVMAQPWPWIGQTDPNIIDGFDEELIERSWDIQHEEWRGYSIIVSELVASASVHKVKEFIIEVRRERTGISQRLLTSQNIDYQITTHLFEIVELTRLDLALNIMDIRQDEDDIFVHAGSAFWTQPLMKQALLKLRNLKHFHLHLTALSKHPEALSATSKIPWLSLQDILPTPHEEAWPHLEHLGLANIYTTEDSLYELLSNLPSLQEIDLDSLLLNVKGRARNLISTTSFLEHIKHTLVDPETGIWKVRRPRWTVRLLVEYPEYTRLTVDTALIHHFLYEDGENPFDLPPRGQKPFHTLPWKIHDFDETPPVRNRYYTGHELKIQSAQKFKGLLYYPPRDEKPEEYESMDEQGNLYMKKATLKV